MAVSSHTLAFSLKPITAVAKMRYFAIVGKKNVRERAYLYLFIWSHCSVPPTSKSKPFFENIKKPLFKEMELGAGLVRKYQNQPQKNPTTQPESDKYKKPFNPREKKTHEPNQPSAIHICISYLPTHLLRIPHSLSIQLLPSSWNNQTNKRQTCCFTHNLSVNIN